VGHTTGQSGIAMIGKCKHDNEAKETVTVNPTQTVPLLFT